MDQQRPVMTRCGFVQSRRIELWISMVVPGLLIVVKDPPFAAK